MQNVSHEQVRLTGGFWREYQELNRKAIVKNVYDRFAETGRFAALKCNWREEMPNKPHIFWDSDVVKWMEGAAYLLLEEKDAELEALVDGMVADIAANQCADGYFNSYFIAVEPSKRFSGRRNHELYCLGHMIEAAIAYDKATGKRTLLDVVLRYTDLVYRVFIEEDSAKFVTPGHEEIELALLKLYAYLGEEKHLTLARFFLDRRGCNDRDEDIGNVQDERPLRELEEASGHAVRAGYLYTAMAMLARIDGDAEMKQACDRLFSNIVNRKMSITGGIGSDHKSERFSYAYDLPNSDTYNETCAAISLALFANAMQELSPDPVYADVIERILYNGFLSGVALDGGSFFYTNPLEIDRKKYQRSTYQPICERVKVFTCSCCPPNVVRMLPSIARFAYTQDGDTLYCNQFMQGKVSLCIGGKDATLEQITDYPNDGRITFRYRGEPMTLCVRIPDWCVEYAGRTDGGYARFALKDGDSVCVELPMQVHFIEANPNVQDDAGRYAVQRGPLVYCLEEVDNGGNLRDVTLLEQSEIRVERLAGIPAPVLTIGAERRYESDRLYRLKDGRRMSFTARLIPYFAFANRGASDMLVWTMVR